MLVENLDHCLVKNLERNLVDRLARWLVWNLARHLEKNLVLNLDDDGNRIDGLEGDVELEWKESRYWWR